MLWYNPPYCRSVKSRLGAGFLEIVSTCFPRDHPLHKILNRNTIKLSPSCMTNVKNILSGQNRSKLANEPMDVQSNYTCTCQQNLCPLQGRCNANDIIYKATITNTPNEHIYLGSTSNRFTRGHWPIVNLGTIQHSLERCGS